MKNIKEILEKNNIDSEEVEHYLMLNFPISEITEVKVLKTIFHIKFISETGLNYDVSLKIKNFQKRRINNDKN